MSILYSGRSKKKEHCLNEELYPLEETETCPCDEFLSQPYGNWSACILAEPSAPGSLQGWMSQREVKECGQGLRYKAVACIDQQGRLVKPTLCTDSGRQIYCRNCYNILLESAFWFTLFIQTFCHVCSDHSTPELFQSLKNSQMWMPFQISRNRLTTL